MKPSTKIILGIILIGIGISIGGCGYGYFSGGSLGSGLATICLVIGSLIAGSGVVVMQEAGK